MIKRIDEHDELLLNRLLDGDLPESEAAALRARINREPSLQAAWQGLERLGGALAESGRDEPDVDFGTFHARVMRAVASERRAAEPAVIRFPTWLRYTTPLAAAAAIALVVTLYRPGTVSPPEVSDGPTSIALVEPEEPDGGTFVVQIRRPTTGDAVASGTPRVRVSFARSDQIATTVAESDQASRSTPSIVSATPTRTASQAIRGTLNLPPL